MKPPEIEHTAITVDHIQRERDIIAFAILAEMLPLLLSIQKISSSVVLPKLHIPLELEALTPAAKMYTPLACCVGLPPHSRISVEHASIWPISKAGLSVEAQRRWRTAKLFHKHQHLFRKELPLNSAHPGARMRHAELQEMCHRQS